MVSHPDEALERITTAASAVAAQAESDQAQGLGELSERKGQT
jgi:hypothetical protein